MKHATSEVEVVRAAQQPQPHTAIAGSSWSWILQLSGALLVLVLLVSPPCSDLIFESCRGSSSHSCLFYRLIAAYLSINTLITLLPLGIAVCAFSLLFIYITKLVARNPAFRSKRLDMQRKLALYILQNTRLAGLKKEWRLIGQTLMSEALDHDGILSLYLLHYGCYCVVRLLSFISVLGTAGLSSTSHSASPVMSLIWIDLLAAPICLMWGLVLESWARVQAENPTLQLLWQMAAILMQSFGWSLLWLPRSPGIMQLSLIAHLRLLSFGCGLFYVVAPQIFGALMHTIGLKLTGPQIQLLSSAVASAWMLAAMRQLNSIQLEVLAQPRVYDWIFIMMMLLGSVCLLFIEARRLWRWLLILYSTDLSNCDAQPSMQSILQESNSSTVHGGFERFCFLVKPDLASSQISDVIVVLREISRHLNSCLSVELQGVVAAVKKCLTIADHFASKLANVVEPIVNVTRSGFIIDRVFEMHLNVTNSSNNDLDAGKQVFTLVHRDDILFQICITLDAPINCGSASQPQARVITAQVKLFASSTWRKWRGKQDAQSPDDFFIEWQHGSWMPPLTIRASSVIRVLRELVNPIKLESWLNTFSASLAVEPPTLSLLLPPLAIPVLVAESVTLSVVTPVPLSLLQAPTSPSLDSPLLTAIPASCPNKKSSRLTHAGSQAARYLKHGTHLWQTFHSMNSSELRTSFKLTALSGLKQVSIAVEQSVQRRMARLTEQPSPSADSLSSLGESTTGTASQ